MSPEQVTGEELDGRTDLFSLGVVLYEALTGHQPFTGKTSAVIFSAILTRAPVAPVVLQSDVAPSASGSHQQLPRERQGAPVSGCGRTSRGSEAHQARSRVRSVWCLQRQRDDGRRAEWAADRRAGSRDDGTRPERAGRAAEGASDRVGWQALVCRRCGDGGCRSRAGRPARSSGLRPARRTTPSRATDAASSPTFVRGRLALATTSIESKDYRAALAYADEVLRVSPDDREAIRIRDAAQAMLTRFDEAIARASQRLAAGDTDGRDERARLRRARSIRRRRSSASCRRGSLVRRALRKHASRPATVEVDAASPATAPSARRVEPIEAAPARVRPLRRLRRTGGAEPAPSSSRDIRRTAERFAASAIGERQPAPPAVGPSRSRPRRRPRRLRDARTARVERACPRAPKATTRPSGAWWRRTRAPSRPRILSLFRTVKPNLSADEQRRIEDGFRAVASQQVNVTIVSIEQRGQEASVRLRRRDTIQAGGRQQITESVQTMTLTRSASGWVIREIAR